jgi:hypothetical protein
MFHGNEIRGRWVDAEARRRASSTGADLHSHSAKNGALPLLDLGLIAAYGLLGNPEQESEFYTQIDERTSVFHYASVRGFLSHRSKQFAKPATTAGTPRSVKLPPASRWFGQ